jgi:hypothetical protein
VPARQGKIRTKSGIYLYLMSIFVEAGVGVTGSAINAVLSSAIVFQQPASVASQKYINKTVMDI